MKLNIIKVILTIAVAATFTFAPAKDVSKDQQASEMKTQAVMYMQDPGGLGG
ncbi:hypothetical protein P4308_22950 [Bacillus wiedmannii]|uniref:hypothetical protein n=1 Tax=Bacillus TaxID=1386 RepID=UPI002E1DD6A9|nr:hypothetical protein [Bacillus wiedmannii]